MSYREVGKTALGKILTRKPNIRAVEKHVYQLSIAQSSSVPMETRYRHNLYQIIGDLLRKRTTKQVLANASIGWQHDDFKQLRFAEEEQNDFIQHPFEVEEGVLECTATVKNTGKVCGSKRVYSYSKQSRSSDEPMTTFATCCACGSQWQYSG